MPRPRFPKKRVKLPPKLRAAANAARGTAVFAEVDAWCDARGIDRPERELVFAKAIKRKWRFDLSWDGNKRVAVELHGGVHSRGRHTSGTGFEKDREKMNEAQLMGWLVLEVTYGQAKNGDLLRWLEMAFNR